MKNKNKLLYSKKKKISKQTAFSVFHKLLNELLFRLCLCRAPRFKIQRFDSWWHKIGEPFQDINIGFRFELAWIIFCICLRNTSNVQRLIWNFMTKMAQKFGEGFDESSQIWQIFHILNSICLPIFTRILVCLRLLYFFRAETMSPYQNIDLPGWIWGVAKILKRDWTKDLSN